jgi:hypothetical protein
MATLEPRTGRYGVGGRNNATAATINHCIGALFNPHGTKSIYVILFTWASISGAASTTRYVQRITARGTPGVTVTPDIDNDYDALLAPISGAVLDLAAYSVQPTLAPPDFFRPKMTIDTPGNIEELYFGEQGLLLPAGTGIGLFQGAGTAVVGDLSFVWDE